MDTDYDSFSPGELRAEASILENNATGAATQGHPDIARRCRIKAIRLRTLALEKEDA